MKNSQALGWVYGNTKKYIPMVAVQALISAAVSVGYVALAYISSYVIDIATGQKSGDIRFYIGLLFLMIILQAVLYVVNSSFQVRINGKLEIYFKSRLFSSLMCKEYKEISKYHSGDILNRFTSDVNVVISGVTGIVPSAVSLFARLAAAVFVLLKFSKGLTAVILVVGVVVGFAARVYSVYFKRIHKRVQESVGNTRSFMQECTENTVVVKSFGSAGAFGEKLRRLMRKTYKLMLRRNMVSNVANVGIYLLFTGGYYAALAWGAFMIDKSVMTYGMLTALLSIVSQVKAPITNMSGLIPRYFAMLASAERIMEIENIDDEPKPLPQSDIDEIYRGMERLRLSDIHFSYDDSREILSCPDMTVEKGEMAALIGNSGEGKSTVFRQLLGLYAPQRGKILLEGTKTLEITPAVRGLFSYVPQGNLIFSGTIGENIRFCKQSATDEEVAAAAKTADIYDFIMSLPDGFETTVGERGIGLSEGQLQRVAIARAILCGAPVLLLDECTSALDEKTEERVLKNIKSMTDRTVIIISHRPAALKICDKIYSVEGGVLRKVHSCNN